MSSPKISPAHEKIFYHYSRKRPELLGVVKPRFFDTPQIAKCWELDKEFHDRFAKVQTVHQMKESVRSHGLQELISDDTVETLFDVQLDELDITWLEENTEAWIEWKNLDTSLFDAIKYLKMTDITVENVKSVVQTVKSLINERNSLDFHFDLGLDFFDPASHIQPLNDTFSTGYEFLDRCLGGGYAIKTLVCFMGPAKIGKSIWLANLAANSIRMGYNTALISLEMRDRKFIKRAGANILSIRMDQYDKTAANQELMKQELSKLPMKFGEMPGKFIIKEFPTSSLSVPDLEAYLKRAEEVTGAKFKTVFVDYANIMSNYRNPNTENTYMKMKQIAEDLRAMAQRNTWAIITATQTNRAGMESNDVSMSNVSESIALVQTVDALFGIMQDPLEKMDNKYRLKALALRDGEGMGDVQYFEVDYHYMRIDQSLTAYTNSNDGLI